MFGDAEPNGVLVAARTGSYFVKAKPDTRLVFSADLFFDGRFRRLTGRHFVRVTKSKSFGLLAFVCLLVLHLEFRLFSFREG